MAYRNYSPANSHIVDKSGNGDFTTIQAAITAASSGQTVFINTGTYTEDLTLKAGVNLAAWDADALTPNVIITGKCTFTAAGTVSISGIKLTTNSDFFLAITGSAASIVYLNNCFLNVLNNTGINFASSSSSAMLFIQYCDGDIATTGITYFTSSSPGFVTVISCFFNNKGLSTTASTNSSGSFTIYNSRFGCPFSVSGAATGSFLNSDIIQATNAVCFTSAGTGGGFISNCYFAPNAASAISAGSGTTIIIVNSTMRSIEGSGIAITGAGTVSYGGLTFSGTATIINTTTQNPVNEGPSKIIGSTNSGGTNTLTVINQSNTASSAANIISQVAGGTAADPTHQSIVNGVTTWTWGADNSDSDAWALAASSALGTTNVMRAGTAGEVTFPLTPAFFAYVNTTITNVTGDGTNYTIIYDTEVYDQGNNFNLGTSTFTAPVTGKYQFNFVVRIQGGTSISASVSICTIATTSLTVRCSTPVIGSTQQVCQGTFPLLINMTAGDTMTTTVQTTDTGGKVDDVGGLNSSQPQTYVSGYLAC